MPICPGTLHSFGGKVVHQLDLAPDASDSSIWQKARSENLVILTRDTDFYYRCQADPSVKVIHLQLANLRLRDLHAFFDRNGTIHTGLLGEAQLLSVSQPELPIVIEAPRD